MTKRQRQALQALERRLNYQFKNFDLLQEAMSHSSLEGAKNNERLEFLGDGVLNLVVAEYLIAHFPHVQEGKLSRMRAQLVCKEALAKVAAAYSISDALILGPSEARVLGSFAAKSKERSANKEPNQRKIASLATS